MNNRIKNIIVTIITILSKYSLILLFIFSPPKTIRPETKKNLAPLPIKEAKIKPGRNIPKLPAEMVNILYGTGEKPAISTDKKPQVINHSFALMKSSI